MTTSPSSDNAVVLETRYVWGPTIQEAMTKAQGMVGWKIQGHPAPMTWNGNFPAAPQAWGGTAASVCSTITVKPLMSCAPGCISDVRQGSDQCLCDAGIMPCPYTYQLCTCAVRRAPRGTAARWRVLAATCVQALRTSWRTARVCWARVPGRPGRAAGS